jgi:hypothetical protein
LLVSGFFVLMTVPFPFKPPFPTMGAAVRTPQLLLLLVLLLQ